MYLTNYAVKLISVPVKPLSIGRLPSYYSAHLKEFADYQLKYFMEHRININIQIEVSYCSTDVPAMKFEAVVDKQKVNILVGANLRRIDYYNAQAFMRQSAAFRSQAAMSISRDLNSISDGIMDSWNMKNASEDRISRNFSEAIRGVNTYTDVNGKSFEFSNQADHVYTDQYGDHIGVSGNSLDENTKTRFNLKEVFKK